MIHLRPTSA